MAANKAQQSAEEDSDAALGYRNEARAARDTALVHKESAAQFSAASDAARTASEAAAGNSEAAAGRAEAAASSAEGVLLNAVQRTSATGAALLPEGDSAQRPGDGNIPAGALVMRGSTQDPADYWAEFWDRATAKWRALADRTWVGKQIDAAIQAVKDWVNLQLGFAIIYPNGGSAAAPAAISINSRYAPANPFPGCLVICEVQLQINGIWGGVGGFIYSTAVGSQAFGVLARQWGDSIVVQAGITALMSASNFDGNPFQISGSVTTPTPARVLVSKVKGKVE
jgi:hypothetical protein